MHVFMENIAYAIFPGILWAIPQPYFLIAIGKCNPLCRPLWFLDNHLFGKLFPVPFHT